MTTAINHNTKPCTYADVLTWPGDERWELIAGIPYCMTLASRPRHQRLLVELVPQMATLLREHRCEVFAAPFDVRLGARPAEPEAVDTVVQPDLSVICDRTKIDERGCAGAPDLVVEILSEETGGRDETVKLKLYETHGVREYWIVNPADSTVRAYTRTPAGTYGFPVLRTAEDSLRSTAVPAVTVDLTELFRDHPAEQTAKDQNAT